MNRGISAIAGRVLFGSGAHQLLLRGQAVVVVFHRVDDRFPGDPITVSRAEFRAYCDFFQRCFRVITLGELLDRLREGRDLSRRLVITFDDGYLDNHEFAAPELRRRELPACFFVTTDFIDSGIHPWWDRASGIHSNWMTWDQVRELHRQGFEIGAHTVSHADLGQVDRATAEREILGGKERLEAEVGSEVRHFCFPYGRNWHLTESGREIVERAGFACCLASYGGTVTPHSDPFYLRRAPVYNWHVSPPHYGLEVALSGR